MPATASLSNWIEIDRRAILENVRRLRQLTSTRLMAVVKANGYGHGILETTVSALQGGASYIGVARIEEALELRSSGVEAPILILGYTHPDRFQEAIQHKISLTIFQPEQVDPLAEAASREKHTALVHVKVDTGMSRLGASSEQAFSLLKKLANLEGILVEGLFTHFARADEPEQPATDEQEAIFFALLRKIESAKLRPPLVHVANSAAALIRPASRMDMVRIGIAMYGMDPSAETPLPKGFKPVLSWKANLSAVYTLPPKRGVSYGHEYVTKAPERVGAVPVGYGDGYRRTAGNHVLIHGKRIPVIGRVCMDQIMVQLDPLPDAKVGDEVVLIGSQKESIIRANDLAQRWNTINYEVTCGLSARVPRIYLG